MLRTNFLPGRLALFTLVIALLTLFIVPAPRAKTQGKDGAKQNPAKNAGKKDSTGESGVIISSDRKTARVKSGFVAKKIAVNKVIISRTDSPRFGDLQEITCSCVETKGSGAADCDAATNGLQIECVTSGACKSCKLSAKKIVMQ